MVDGVDQGYCFYNFRDLDQVIRPLIRQVFDDLAAQARDSDVVRAKLVKTMMATRRLGDSFGDFADGRIAAFADAINGLPIQLHREILDALIDAVRDGVEVHLEIQRADPDRLFAEDGPPAWAADAAFVSTRTIYNSGGTPAERGRQVRYVRLGLPTQMLAELDQLNPG
jgi:hypothetical protein